MKPLFLILLTTVTFAQSPFWRMELMENATASSTPDITTNLVALWQNGDTTDVTGRGNDLTRSHTNPTPSPDAFVFETIYQEGSFVTYNGIVWRSRQTTEFNIPEEGTYWTHHQPYKTATGLAGIDSAITFNGIDHYLSRASTTDLQLGVTAFTISIWVNGLSESGNGIIKKGDEYYLDVSDGPNIRFLPNALVTNGPGTGWHHIVVVCTPVVDASDGTGIIYVNGIPGVSFNEMSYSLGDAIFSVASSPEWGYLNGQIAQLAIYKRALTAEQITYLYNGGDGRLITPVIP